MDRDLAWSMFEHDAPERDALLVAAGFDWSDEREWYEIVGVRDEDSAIRGRNVSTVTLAWRGS